MSKRVVWTALAAIVESIEVTLLRKYPLFEAFQVE